jgi:hypothetical protein
MCLDTGVYQRSTIIHSARSIIAVLASVMFAAGSFEDGCMMTVTPLMSAQTNSTSVVQQSTSYLVDKKYKNVSGQLLHASMLHFLGLTSIHQPLLTALCGGDPSSPSIASREDTWRANLTSLALPEFRCPKNLPRSQQMEMIAVSGHAYLCNKGTRSSFLSCGVSVIHHDVFSDAAAKRVMAIDGRLAVSNAKNGKVLGPVGATNSP